MSNQNTWMHTSVERTNSHKEGLEGGADTIIVKKEARSPKILRARSVIPVARCSTINEIKERHTHLESNMVIRHRRTVLAPEQRDIYTHETLATFRLIPPFRH